VKVGVLALQGAFAEHIKVLSILDIDAIPVRLPSDLAGVQALIIPGGESTAISKLLLDYRLMEPIRDLIKEGIPVLGTCAGMVLLAKKVTGAEIEPIGIIDIEIKRNAYGRQIESFESDLSIPVLGDKAFHGVFIRAPIIQKLGSNVEVLCRVSNNTVAVKEGNVIACAFHPELTNDLRFHKYFLRMEI
jgi:5'-phosphate synthase pdxT subunit